MSSPAGSSIIRGNGERDRRGHFFRLRSRDVDKDKVFPYPWRSELIVICRITTATSHKNIRTRESFVILVSRRAIPRTRVRGEKLAERITGITGGLRRYSHRSKMKAAPSFRWIRIFRRAKLIDIFFVVNIMEYTRIFRVCERIGFRHVTICNNQVNCHRCANQHIQRVIISYLQIM